MYLDHAATTTIRPEAVDAMARAFSIANGNASGTHAVARAAKNELEQAREIVAELLGADRADEIVFTSGGTESDNLAVVGSALAHDGTHVVISTIEHKAVTEAAHALERFGYRVDAAGCDAAGVVAPDAVVDATTDDTAVVSVMAANNEVGTRQPIVQIVEVVKERRPRALVHTDAVQAYVGGQIAVGELGVDLATFAAHKFGGPKGVGILYVRSGTRLDPLLRGGGQEAGRRSGTSNVPGVVGTAAAMQAVERTREAFARIVGEERDIFETVLSEELDITVTAATADRMPHFSHVRIHGMNAETLLIRLDRAGVFAAAGSACQSGAIEPSHVLTAMGMDAAAASECVRFTFGWDTGVGDGRKAAEQVVDIVRGTA